MDLLVLMATAAGVLGRPLGELRFSAALAYVGHHLLVQAVAGTLERDLVTAMALVWAGVATVSWQEQRG